MKTKGKTSVVKSFEEYKSSYFPSQTDINIKNNIEKPEQIGVLLARESFKKIDSKILKTQ